ncbi:MAG TPA: MFS transporter [Alphaproteobacteria bacterium]|jgi:MFS family permease|nr:MFS transporter [Alphaproteobacteria bacterium]
MTSTAVASATETPLFRIAAFRYLFSIRIASTTSNQMMAVVVGWQIYDLTNSALALGMIGLVQFAAPLLLTLVAGEMADRYDRRFIIRCCYAVQTIVMFGLLGLTLLPQPPVIAFYLLLLLNSFARTFEGPTLQSLVTTLVPGEMLSRAVAAYASSGRIAMLSGPMIGGFIYEFGAATDYLCCLILISIAATSSFMLPKPKTKVGIRGKASLRTLLAGYGFIWANPILLGVLSLDLMATFFGGLTALLPIYARDILHIDAWGFGILRSAPSIGALTMGIVLAHYPITRHAGKVMLGGVGLYGVATVMFAFSTNPILSVLCLFLVGFGDVFSQVIRHTLVQTRTPDEMRGRVSAVGSLSVNIGGQLGQFEAGVAAALLGTVGAAAFGGFAVLIIVAMWAMLFPDLRKVERPDEKVASA